ncbi:PEP-CTERM sorting domain-containing protein [Roseateles sp. DAIF2]|uniref:NF038120 family PEP-CTERM protein n=1 Tax=Roseateles sp. DAIF2 TaxID=2714952 RepID=UPI0018A2EBA2|nr:NF038120 family PEP-CTERM protein [Roseateles sp. DAIF2]QPF73461.1 PEP-CTERM sorting domain-containing protein [Roseateles sp. DAIF2]
MTRIKMKRALAALALGAGASISTQASPVTFDDILPQGFSGSSIVSGGITVTSSGEGFSNVDSALAYGAIAPDNSTGQFLAALNNDAITLALGGGRFLGLDAAFIAPVPIAAGTAAGMLQIVATTATGIISDQFDFGLSGANGVWSFFSIDTDLLGSSAVTSLTLTACLYDGLGGCVRDASLSQFGIDNLRVPEPGTIGLVLAAIGLMAATRRRQSV